MAAPSICTPHSAFAGLPLFFPVTHMHAHTCPHAPAHAHIYLCTRTYTCVHTHENAHPQLHWACFAHLDLKDDVNTHQELLCPHMRLRGELFYEVRGAFPRTSASVCHAFDHLAPSCEEEGNRMSSAREHERCGNFRAEPLVVLPRYLLLDYF